MDSYVSHCGGDDVRAVQLYQWNSEISGAMWETIGHLEIALRNGLANRLSLRHTRLGRAGTWLDTPVHDLDPRAGTEIAKAQGRVRLNGKPAGPGQTISELSFGFWRFLLARRYTSTLWPDLARAFPHAPSRNRALVEEPVARVHLFRNRLAHHQKIWTEPITARFDDALLVLEFIDPDLAGWVHATSRVTATLAACPEPLPHRLTARTVPGGQRATRDILVGSGSTTSSTPKPPSSSSTTVA